jgi:hypothetical protein
MGMKIFKQKIAFGACCLGMVGLALPQQSSRAGWTGYLLGSGSGWAYVSVAPYINGTNAAAKQLKTPSTLSPGAWMAAITPQQDLSNTNQYTTNVVNPTGASTNTISRAKGFPGVIWQAYTAGANGDKTDNFELQQRVKIKPTTCPSLVMDSALTDFNGTAGQITVNTLGTAGTALWIRGFEITADMNVPEDDLGTPQNETTEYLKTHADLRFENLMIGPFEYGYNGKCELVVHFTLNGGSIDNLAFVTDGVALSEPISINCPPDASVACGDSYPYPDPSATGGCGKFTYSFDPPTPADLVVGVNTVTLTATDEAGDSESCTWVVNVYDNTPPKPDTNMLATVTGQCSATITTRPTATDKCVGPVIGTTKDPLTYTQQGVHTVTWKFDDGYGNVSTQTQLVEVDDTIAPVAPVLADVLSGCSEPVRLTAPVANDNCAGPITGTTTTQFPLTALGTYSVLWTFNDGNGNTSTATQKVVISGLTFVGFYAPIGTSGGSCSQTAKDIKVGSVIPIKFDIKCGSTVVTTGRAPVVKIEQYSRNCVLEGERSSVNAEYQNDWHANWDTTNWPKGIYKIVVVLPDNSEAFVFVNLK